MAANGPNPIAPRKHPPRAARRAGALAALIVAIAANVTPLQAQTTTMIGEVFSSFKTLERQKSLDVGDPVTAGNGQYHFTLPLLDLGGPMSLVFELLYRSDYLLSGPGLALKYYWSPYTSAEIQTEGGVTYGWAVMPDGDQVTFRKTAADQYELGPADIVLWEMVYLYDNTPQVKYVLQETAGYLYILDPINEWVYVYEKFLLFTGGCAARVVYVLDRNGNRLTYLYQAPDNERVARIEDGLGRSLDFEYHNISTEGWEVWCLKKVTDHGGRSVSFTHEYKSPANRDLTTLIAVTDAGGRVTTFDYASTVGDSLVARETRPLGNTPYTQTWESLSLDESDNPRVRRQTDAYDNETWFAYDPGVNAVDVTRPDGGNWRYEHFSYQSHPQAVTDPDGQTARFTRDADARRDSVTDTLGDQTRVSYHAASGKVASLSDAAGRTTAYSFAAQEQTFTNPASREQVTFTFHNLARVTYPDGAEQQFSRDASGNVTSVVDRAGHTWNYTYNGRGQLLSLTNPRGGVWNYTYHPDGTLATSKAGDLGTTAYACDTLGRVTKVTGPDGSFTQLAYDAYDQVLAVTDENGHTYSCEYDANGNLTRVTDPAGHEIRHTYDLLDRLTRVTDRLGQPLDYAYDSMGRIATVTDANGTTTSAAFGADGALESVTLGGKTWQGGYDSELILASTTSPSGQTTTLQTDPLGRLIAITNPMGQTVAFARDSIDRVTRETDPLGRQTSYAYDANDLLTGITLPNGGTVQYGYDSCGLLTSVEDPGGHTWTIDYNPIGLPTGLADPLGRRWEYAYNADGQPVTNMYPDGAATTLGYDPAGNTVLVQSTDGTTVQYIYNVLDSVLATDGVALARDAEDRITSSAQAGRAFGAAYDGGGRLRNVTYDDGAFAVSYGYSQTTGLLQTVADSLTGTEVHFSYDTDGRLSGIERPSGLQAQYSYDAAGRLTRIQDGAILDLQYAYDAAGKGTGLRLTAPLDPADLQPEFAGGLTYDQASQISSAGYAYDAQGRLTASPGAAYQWDGLSRLRAAGGATLDYNGFMDPVTRTEDGRTTRFFYNYAFDQGRLVAEQDESTGQFTRFYVWTPEGSLLYLIDATDGNKVLYYHFDRNGSTLALTDSSGVVTDAYAYDPAGQVLRHEGNHTGPFTFLGRGGVRQEGPEGTLYQAHARYYDSVSARFLSPDPAWPELEHPLELNPYLYAQGDPNTFVDVDGLQGDVSGDFWNGYSQFHEKAQANFQKQVAQKKGLWDVEFRRFNRNFRETKLSSGLKAERWGSARDPNAVVRLVRNAPNGNQSVWFKARLGTVGRLAKGNLTLLATEAYWRGAFWFLQRGCRVGDIVKQRIAERLAKEKAEQEKAEREEAARRRRKELERRRREQEQVERNRARGLNMWNVFPEQPRPVWAYRGFGIWENERTGERKSAYKLLNLIERLMDRDAARLPPRSPR